jgi:hypothetical protein
MPPPLGLIDKNNYVIGVTEQPAVIRTNMPGQNGGKNIPRGIAVGLPELVNYCFDADACMLRYAWAGGFLDMKPSWSGRGGQVVRVQGKPFYSTNTFPLRIGGSTEPPKVKFEGYEFDDHHVPQFLYRVGEIEVRETLRALQKELSIVRTFELETKEPVTIVLADEAGVTFSSDVGEFKPGDAEKTRMLRVPAGKAKFSVTIRAKEGK